MGFLDIFKKKKLQPAAPAPYGAPDYSAPMDLPVDQIITLQQQGLTNNQIIQTLQRQGYQPQEIYDALAQLEMREAVAPAPPAPGMPAEFPEAAPKPAEAPKGFEETAEAIFEEKWTQFSSELAKITEWKESVTARIDKVEQSVTDFKADLDSLHKAIVSKISDYDRSLQDVGVEIKAMEKVFQKVLPELTGSVTELSRITKTVRAKAPITRPALKKAVKKK